MARSASTSALSSTHAPEGPGGDLDLLVDAALGLLDGTLAGDHQPPAGDLEPDRGGIDAGDIDLDHRLRRPGGVIADVAVVDVDAGENPGVRSRRQPGPLPDVSEELVHLPPDAVEVDEEIALARHALDKLTRSRRARDHARRSKLVDRALDGDLDGRAERLRALLTRPFGVELVGDVGEDHPLGAGEAGVLAGLRRGQMTALSGPLGARQRRLDDQQIRVTGGLDDLLAGPAVGAEGEPAAACCAGQVDREGLGEVRDAVESRLERARPGRCWSARTRRRGTRCRSAPPDPRSRRSCAGLRRRPREVQLGASRVVGPRPALDRDRLLAGCVGERVGVTERGRGSGRRACARSAPRRRRRSRGAGGASRRRRCRNRAGAPCRPPRSGSRCKPRPRPARTATCPSTVTRIGRSLRHVQGRVGAQRRRRGRASSRLADQERGLERRHQAVGRVGTEGCAGTAEVERAEPAATEEAALAARLALATASRPCSTSFSRSGVSIGAGDHAMVGAPPPVPFPQIATIP